ASGGLSKDDVDKMQRDAEANAADDKRKRDLAEARNAAEQRVYQVEKTLEDNKEKLSEGDRSAINSIIAKVNAAKEGTDVTAIQSATDELTKAVQAMSEKLYTAAADTASAPGAESAAGAEAGASAGGQKPDDVIDVDFEEKS
ncbi:MAG: Hsp70 family protein, partial [bacterium]